MKARIGKLEGDLRTNKKLRESMEKHIKMLENALRRSREKNANGQETGNGVTESSETKNSAKSSPRPKREYENFQSISEANPSSDVRQTT